MEKKNVNNFLEKKKTFRLNFFKMHKASYDMKNSICLFERLFKVQKIGIFLFGISFFFGFRDIDIFVLYKLGK